MLLIIDNYDSFTYNLYQVVASCYADVRVVRNDQITLDEIKRLNPIGIILSPGPGRPEESGICITLIQAIAANELRMPLLGVCLGHQAITVAFGGQVIQANEIMHGKEDSIYHCQTGLYETLPLPFKAARYHSLIAEKSTLPADLMIEAETKQHLIMGIRHKTLPIFGVQFHPESIMTPQGTDLLTAFIARCKQHISTSGIAA